MTNPFGRGYLHWIRWIHRSHAIRGANNSAMVVMFVDCCVGSGWYFLYYSYRTNPKSYGPGVFCSHRTLLAVKQLTVLGTSMPNLWVLLR
jgi:hypothetical protein